MTAPGARNDLLDRLHRLAAAMVPTERDTVEVSFHSPGHDGALIVTDAPRPDEMVTAALRCSALSEGELALLLELVEELPSQCRRGVRLLNDGGVSLYWERRTSPDEQVRIAQTAQQHTLAAVAQTLAFPALGTALQIGVDGGVRMRLYTALPSVEDLVVWLDDTPDEVGLPRAAKPELLRLWQGLEPSYPVIANISCIGAEDSVITALKLEFPRPKLWRLSALGSPSGPEEAALRRAKEWIADGDDALNFLGVRTFGKGRRELTFYVKADHLLR